MTGQGVVVGGAGMIEAQASAFVLIAARVVPSVVLVPAFGAPALPLLLRFGFALGATAWLFAGLQPHLGWGAMGGNGVLFVRELCLGLVLAWLSCLTFRGIQTVGLLIDHGRGAALATGPDIMGATHDSVSPLSALFGLLAVVVFAEIDGPAHFVAALARSYEVLPLVGSHSSLASPSLLIGTLARLVSGIFEVAVGLAAPVLVAIWLTELGVAIVGRMTSARTTDLSSIMRCASPLSGLAAVLLSLGLLRAGIEGWLSQIPRLLLQVVKQWSLY